MRVISCSLQNFASYRELEFDFSNQGLTLIQGPTGSGKSTLCDAIPWILFGRTAKNGAVDEIKSWNNTEETWGRALVYIHATLAMEVTRIRGKTNDLYYNLFDPTVYQDTSNIIPNPRGKDLNDTQKLINNILGIDCDAYLAGAYFHEFSQTAQFFVTTARNRRAICEQIVDLTLAKELQVNIAIAKKKANEELNEVLNKTITLRSNIELMKNIETAEKNKRQKWNEAHKKTIEYVEKLYDKFEATRKQIITNECDLCGTVLEKPREVVNTNENPYLQRLAELEKEQNPFAESVTDYSKDIEAKNIEACVVDKKRESISVKTSDLELLGDVVSAFRSTLVKNTIMYVENQTNELLSKHFDAEIKVSFEVTNDDKLEVEIQKDGNLCTYSQLSKGQRQLLKLCFGVSVMKAVSNHSGVKFNQVFLDESMDGMDDNFKTKAYRLLEELALDYESVFVVEHSETLKVMFPKSFKVSLENGNSQIEEA